jgi:hypothetical protein
MRFPPIVPLLLVLSWPAGGLAGERGVAELTLDRQSVRALVAAGLPEPLRLEAAGLGTLTLKVQRPDRVDFVEGGINVLARLDLVEAGLSVDLLARYLPRSDPHSGVFRFVPDSVVPDAALPVEIDLAGWLGPIELPRRFEWELELESGRRMPVTCFLQGLEIREDRLELRLGLISTEGAAVAPRSRHP